MSYPGISPSSIGFTLLERLLADSGADIWHALAVGKATLILPADPSKDSKITITPEFIKDHIGFLDSSSTQIVTLSGLRAILQNSTLTFRSSLHPSSKLHHTLHNPSSREHAFTQLPPLPLPYHHPSEHPVPYPSFTLLPRTDPLSIPLLQPKPPPLPPRPTSSPPQHRLHPFASLFGVGPNSIPRPPKSTGSPSTLTSPLPPETSSITVPILLIDKPIIRRDLGKAINAAIGAELARALTSRGPGDEEEEDDNGYDIPEWVADRVNEFVLGAGLFPFIKEKLLPPGLGPGPGVVVNKRLEVAIAGRGAVLRRERRGASDAEEDSYYYTYAVSNWVETPEEISQVVQDFYNSLEKEVRERSSTRGEEQRQDALVTRIVESCEDVLASLFYDRLFIQPTSDDASHDETLSSRAAALNMLDLTLRHLDIDVGQAREEDVDVVVKACGDKLTQLETCRTPKEKSTVLVAAHKLVVDGLSKLPPIKLIPDSDSDDKPPPSLPPPPYGGELKELKHRDTPPDSPQTPEKKPNTTPGPVSGDVLLPFLIFSVVKSNPPHLVSHLLFTQRFRSSCCSSSSPFSSSGGEENYCLINLMAVAEFLENVDLAALGLAPPQPSPLLTPILGRSSEASGVEAAGAGAGATGGVLLGGISPGLRGRVEQQVDAIAVSANKVLTGVMDTSFGMLKSLIPGQGGSAQVLPLPLPIPPQPSKRESGGFSLSSIAASIPIVSSSSSSRRGENPEDGQQMVTVSRPSFIGEGSENENEGEGEGEGEEQVIDNGECEGEEGEEEEGSDNEDIQTPTQLADRGSVRSIKSFESMMNERSGYKVTQKKVRGVLRLGGGGGGAGGGQRKSLSDRLANMSALAGIKGSPSASSRNSLMATGSRPVTPGLRIPPPVQRFLDCSCDELRIGEVEDLLKEYRRLVEAVRAVGGFSIEPMEGQ
ncbi:hypothetical protein F5887DRAFT_1139443 [Amanita rubescens]|nr:hypothetical protein F5887DRAFT_1139443 [Amanita rubescens]